MQSNNSIDFLDFDELLSFSDNIKDDEIAIINNDYNNYKKCKKCDEEMEVNSNNTMLCIKCGCIEHVITENNEYEKSSSANYNTNDSYHLSVKCTGQGSYIYQKTIRNYTSNYGNIHKNFIVKKLNSKYFQNNKINIPKDIINNATATYIQMKNDGNMEKYRASVLDGLLGTIIYYECLNNNIAVKQKEIADWFGININKITKTDKIIKELNTDDKFNIDKLDHKFIFINSFCKRINIPDNYIKLLYEILLYIEEKKIGNKDSKLSTKTASLIYVLIISDKTLNITDLAIVNEFDVSLSTMKTFYKNLIKHYEKINIIFNKYDINLYKK